jgi:hypothetical protein
MDVVSLYTNIPHDEGAEFVCQFYEETLEAWRSFNLNIDPIDKETLHELILFILHNCTFEFNRIYFKQNYGTTMGAKFSVKFANIYMYMWFRTYLTRYTGIKPVFIARLIDDCFFKWPHSEAELLDFFSFLNSCHSSIKFEFQYSKNNVTFLDTVTYIRDDTIHTNIYTKPSDKKQYLFFSSCHPAHVAKAIPYSQAIRYRRIIDDDALLLDELANLKSKFLNRGYPSSLLDSQLNKVVDLDRNALLTYKNQQQKRDDFQKFLKGKSFLPLIIMFHSGLNSIAFRNDFHDLFREFASCNDDIKSVFEGELPQLVFKRGNTVSQVVTRAIFGAPPDALDIQNVDILVSLPEENVPT